MVFELVDDDDFPSPCLLTDDIWDKFQFANIDLMSIDSGLEMGQPEVMLDATAVRMSCEIRNHDCMWAGHCGSKEHSMEDAKSGGGGGGPLFRPLPICPMMPIQQQQQQQSPKTTIANTIAPGRSLLLKTQQPQPQQQQQHHQVQVQTTTTASNIDANLINAMLSYESPPNSDDDEDNKSSVLRYLQDAISECDIDDKDLHDYFEDNKVDQFIDDEDEDEDMDEEEEEDEEVEVKEESHNETMVKVEEEEEEEEEYNRSVMISQLVNDHCYFKDQTASMRNLGIDTPSDSEEEIDVVSTDDKRGGGGVGALPTNPTSRDRHQLQQTMATAINKTSGIRTLLPRKPTTPMQTKRRVDGRGVKRSRHHHHRSNHHSPPHSKKRMSAMYHQQMSSDSEQEPAEKRIEHNNMERQRRIDLRNAFEELRVLVPEVGQRERAPKVIILREAAMYCHQLGHTCSSMQRQVDEMRRQQRQLRARLANLRTKAATMPRRRR